MFEPARNELNIELLTNGIKINNHVYLSPIIIFQNNILNIPIDTPSISVLNDLNLEAGTLILIGTNTSITPEFMSSWTEWSFEHQFGIEIMSFKSACRLSTILNDENRKFVTILFPQNI